MSGHGHDDADAAHSGHDDHHAHETTSDDFPADEPRSPGWLPLLGGALFLAGIFAFVVFGTDGQSAAGAAKQAASAEAPAAAPSPGSAKRPAAAVLPPGAVMPPNHEQLVKRPFQ